jgi:exosortase
MYRQENRIEFDPQYLCSAPAVKRRRAELVIEPREAPIPGGELASTIVLSSGTGRVEFALSAVAAILLLAVIAAAYGREAATVVAGWWHEPGFSYAFALPVIAVCLLWLRREERPLVWQGNWWGLAIVFVGGCADVAATWSYYNSVRPFALLLTLCGLCILAGGRAAWRWCWPAMLFLGFSLPLPSRLLAECNPPIERWTASAGAYVCVALGLPAVSAGTELTVGDHRFEVTDSWSGMGCVVECLAVSSAVALLIQAGRWERSLIVLGALPIALAGNMVRLVLTASLQQWGELAAGAWLLGELGCWLMIPLALGFVWVERQVLSRALVTVPIRGPVALPFDRARTSTTLGRYASSQPICDDAQRRMTNNG